MSDINELAKNFNSVVIDFTEQLVKLNPSSIVINNVNRAKMAMKVSKIKLLDQFVLHILEHKEYFDNKDDYIFLNISFPNSKIITAMIKDVRSLWNTISDDNKDRIFEYFQVLCYYSREYVLLLTDK